MPAVPVMIENDLFAKAEEKASAFALPCPTW